MGYSKENIKINRRDFLKVMVTAFIGVPVFMKIIGCGKDEYGSNSTPPADESGFSPVSSVDTGHSHFVRILYADITNPPAAGVTYTSSSSGHTHTIFLSQQQLTAINAGSTVTVVSSVDSGHSHNWTITKP
ncbi:MAG: hypothetical protein AB1498_05910 [bacterium]